MSLNEVKARFEELGIAAQSELRPCTEAQVKELERSLSQPLPKAYREFLLWTGQGAGDFLLGSHCFYQHLADIQQWAIELLVDSGFPRSLPEDAFVFIMHQGYQFMFFRLSEGEDPPVYFVNEAERSTDFERAYEHLSEFLLAAVESYSYAGDEEY